MKEMRAVAQNTRIWGYILIGNIVYKVRQRSRFFGGPGMCISCRLCNVTGHVQINSPRRLRASENSL